MAGAHTTLCISVAKRPGSFGITVHNAGYQALGLDYLYKAYGATEIAPIISAVRTLGIRGCSVSMPFKIDVMAHLDTIDPTALSVGAVNTVVNEGGQLKGQLKGYNTDATGFRAAWEALQVPTTAPIVVLGAGGMARAVVWALHSTGHTQVTVAGRRPEEATRLAARYGFATCGWEARMQHTAQVLINATPIGMAPDVTETPVNLSSMPTLTHVVDVVATPPATTLIGQAKAAGLATLSGFEITMEQACHQFTLYTGQPAPRAAMEAAAAALVSPAAKSPA